MTNNKTKKHPDYDKDEVINRLIAENSQQNNILQQIRIALSMDKKYYGTSLIGGIKALIKEIQKIREENFQLKLENKKLKNK